MGLTHVQRNKIKQEWQPLLKAKYCPRIPQCRMNDKHYIYDPNVCDLSLVVCIFNRLLQGIMGHARAIFRESRPTGCESSIMHTQNTKFM